LFIIEIEIIAKSLVVYEIDPLCVLPVYRTGYVVYQRL